MKRFSAVVAAVALAIVAAPAQAHDPSCILVYENITGTIAFASVLAPDYELLDDVHTNVSGTIVLCAVDVRGRPTAAGTLSVSVYANGGDGLAPGALLAGPIPMVFPAGLTSNAIYHFEFPMPTVGQNLWIGQRWTAAGGAWVPTPRTTPTVGTSHDTWYFRTPSGDFFDDNGTSQADLHLDVFGTAPVAAAPSTWGAVKAIYR